MDATRQLALQYARGKPTGRLREAHALADELRAMPDRKAAEQALALTTTMEGSTADRLDAVRAFYAFLRDDDAAIGAAAVKQREANVEAMRKMVDASFPPVLPADDTRHAVIELPGLRIVAEVISDLLALTISADPRDQLRLPAHAAFDLKAGHAPAQAGSEPEQAPAPAQRRGEG